MLEHWLLQEVLAVALARGGDFADIFIERRVSTAITCEDRRIDRIQGGCDLGAGIRVCKGELTAYAYTNDLSRESLLQAADAVSRAISAGKQGVVLALRRIEPRSSIKVEVMPQEVALEHKVDLILRTEEAARAVDATLIKQVVVGYGDTTQEVYIANSRGEYVEDQRVRTRLVVQAVAAADGVIQTGYEAIGACAGFELFQTVKGEELAQIAARRAVEMLKAPAAPAGLMPVVMAGSAGGTMVHEACGHGLEADLVQKNLSVYAGKIGQQVAAPEVTVIDDATLPGKYGSYVFDDEGTPAEKVVLIDKGVLQDYLYDRLTAIQAGRESNGHGRRESYQHKPIPRMANTYIAPGREDAERIIRSVKRGLLVKKMGGGQVNTTTGDFVFEVAEGYLIEDGEVKTMVRGATLTGNGPEVLRSIEAVGGDLGFTIGICGKDGQGVPVSDAQPTILIPRLTIGGTGEIAGAKKIYRR